jgi:hypothetical protein
MTSEIDFATRPLLFSFLFFKYNWIIESLPPEYLKLHARRNTAHKVRFREQIFIVEMWHVIILDNIEHSTKRKKWIFGGWWNHFGFEVDKRESSSSTGTCHRILLRKLIWISRAHPPARIWQMKMLRIIHSARESNEKKKIKIKMWAARKSNNDFSREN